MTPTVGTTQERHPWRATVRTIFQGILGFAAAWGVIVQAAGLDPDWAWVSASLAATGAVTRIMALPAVESWLRTFVPWLAAERDDPTLGV